ncbi:MAG: MurT ligase domain-containing protein [Roseiflexaceae bacterium]|nr:MurT ligase domain-containing protein [Roseiflexaceae bacterium]
MIDLRLLLAVAAGKSAGIASRMLRRGGGTTLPGVVAQRIDPQVLQKLTATLPRGVVLVSGTNGKTTTTRMIAAILADDGRTPLHNRAGANLMSGVTATALAGASLGGRTHAHIGLFETDEAAFPGIAAETAPRLVVLHNLFRDQLDRYGEVDTVAQGWRAALERLPATTTVLLNADDPAVAALGEGLSAKVRYYGLNDLRHASGAAAQIGDARFCRRCGAPYRYTALFYAHIGHYRCDSCGAMRPTPDYALERLDLHGTETTTLYLTFPGSAMEVHLPLPGLYNAINALAAIAACRELGVPASRIRATLERFDAAFGRIERVDAGGRPLLIALIKNPVGATETIRMLTNSLNVERSTKTLRGDTAAAETLQGNVSTGNIQPSTLLHLLILINDRYADGTDVSWLWDAEFERLAGHVAHATVGGTRAADMAVRLKYAGVEPERMTVADDPAEALDVALSRLPPGATLYALPTYTAMLDLRAELVRRRWARPFWED